MGLLAALVFGIAGWMVLAPWAGIWTQADSDKLAALNELQNRAALPGEVSIGMPDGTILRNAPEGVTGPEIQERWETFRDLKRRRAARARFLTEEPKATRAMTLIGIIMLGFGIGYGIIATVSWIVVGFLPKGESAGSPTDD